MYIIDRRIIHFKLQHTNIENLLTSPINFVRSTRTVAIHKVPSCPVVSVVASFTSHKYTHSNDSSRNGSIILNPLIWGPNSKGKSHLIVIFIKNY